VGQLDNVNPNFLYLSVTFGGHQNEFVAWLTSKPFLLYQIIVYEYMGVYMGCMVWYGGYIADISDIWVTSLL